MLRTDVNDYDHGLYGSSAFVLLSHCSFRFSSGSGGGASSTYWRISGLTPGPLQCPWVRFPKCSWRHSCQRVNVWVKGYWAGVACQCECFFFTIQDEHWHSERAHRATLPPFQTFTHQVCSAFARGHLWRHWWAVVLSGRWKESKWLMIGYGIMIRKASTHVAAITR